MTVEEEGRAKAIQSYKILLISCGLLGVGLLACGIAAAVSPNSGSFGLPYFIGGFLVGILNLLSAVLCMIVVLKAPHVENEIKKRKVACAMQGQYILAMVTVFGCFMGCIAAGLGGTSSASHYDDDDDYEDSARQTLAIIILIGCIAAIFLVIFSMYTVCTYGKYFGVQIKQYRRRTRIFINGEPSTVQASTVQPTHYTTSNQVNELEKQNRLLQQQLDLQKQISQQQQQYLQQTQYSGGVYPPPPPPSYGASGSAPEYPRQPMTL